jgi:uncharacterized protein (TIGR01777 family)
MVVVIAGGSGFLGRALQDELRRAGHHVRVLTRRAAPTARDAIAWPADGTIGPWASALEDADVVINLAGAGIADARWTSARKSLLYDSRVLSTRSLALAIERTSRRPILISASGVGYYGDREAQVVTEDTPPGDDFLAKLCIDWEKEALQAAAHTRVVILRNGLVMDPTGGALGKMLLPFRLGLGGPLGSGTQYLPWIHIADWLALVMLVAQSDDARGPFNATAPNPATNAEFTRALGRALSRPAIIPVPGFALRTALGELADTLLTGQRAVPKRAEQLGFRFRFRAIEPALNDLLR